MQEILRRGHKIYFRQDKNVDSQLSFPDPYFCRQALLVFDYTYQEACDFRISTEHKYLDYHVFIDRIPASEYDHTKLSLDDKKKIFSIAKKLFDYSKYERITFYEYTQQQNVTNHERYENNIWFMIELDPSYQELEDEIEDMNYQVVFCCDRRVFAGESNIDINNLSFTSIFDKLSNNKLKVDCSDLRNLPNSYLLEKAIEIYDHILDKKYIPIPKEISDRNQELKSQVYSLVNYWMNKRDTKVDIYRIDEDYNGWIKENMQ